MVAVTSKRQVLILGGGFGGVKAALELSQSPAYEVTILSDFENFRYYPTLYRAAMGGSKTISSFPLREVFKDKPVKLTHGSAKTIDRQKKIVKTNSGKSYHYDILIVALGVVTNFFGIKGLAKYAYGIKTLEQARQLRDHLHRQLVEDNKPDVNYVIIGGGATGVELAGELPGYMRHIMRTHGIKKKTVNVELVEAEQRLMPKMPKPYSQAVAKRLRRLGVKVHLGQKVQAQTADELMVNGKPIDSHTVVWTAGVTNHPFLKANDFGLSGHGRVITDRYLQSEPGIYVIGDNADTPYSGMAQTALHDGSFIGRNLLRMASGKPARAYRPKTPIYITPVGPNWAAMAWGHTQVYGWAGWVMRSAADLVGYHDLQPLLPASKRWLAMADTEESCAICFKRP
jgi:NADH dehydrogenase